MSSTNKTNSSFFQLGNARIKLSNIKTYGIGEETYYFRKVYEKKKKKGGLLELIFGVSSEYNGKNNEIFPNDIQLMRLKQGRGYMF